MDSSVYTVSNVLTREQLNFILSLPSVNESKRRIEDQTAGSVYFSVTLPSELKAVIHEKLGLDLTGVDAIPFRWIKGDSVPHIDRGAGDFEKTYLMYLTDNVGSLVLGEEMYPITQGSAYVFSEGIRHETVGTGSEPRLLLGPMSEEGLAVGAATTISANGENEIIYFKYISGSGIYYRINSGGDIGPSLPITITNTNTSYPLKVLFETDINIGSDIMYFVCGSDNIQFGSESLKMDGTRPKIYIDGVNNYPGFIHNGDSLSNGFSNINIYNIEIEAINGSTLAQEGGWLCAQNFGNGSSNNYIVNCHSSGDIPEGGGGIAGGSSINSGSFTMIGCSSTGLIGDQAGGIVGRISGGTGRTVIVSQCWSTGVISGNGAGGIVGANSSDITITDCYSTGAISGANAGGIIGGNAGSLSGTIRNCYSRGDITGDSTGGICGSDCSNVLITNCYSSGNLDNTIPKLNGSICGPIFGVTNLTITNCYTSGTVSRSTGYIIGNVSVVNGTSPSQYTLTNNYSEAGSVGGTPGIWSNAHANTVLTGTPGSEYSSSSVWLTITGTGTEPYLLFNMGYTPYSTTIISSVPELIKTSSATVTTGNSTPSAIKTFGIYYAFLEDYSTIFEINIDPATGIISTTANTPPDTYTLYVYNTGSYHITTFSLTVLAGVSNTADVICCDRTLVLNNTYNEINTILRAGNTISGGVRRGVMSYSDMIKLKMAQASKH